MTWTSTLYEKQKDVSETLLRQKDRRLPSYVILWLIIPIKLY